MRGEVKACARGCGRPARAKGLCAAHYARERRGGDDGAPLRRQRGGRKPRQPSLFKKQHVAPRVPPERGGCGCVQD